MAQKFNNKSFGQIYPQFYEVQLKIGKIEGKRVEYKVIAILRGVKGTMRDIITHINLN